MESYEQSRRGKLIGWGGEHVVFRYGENEVIKFSLLYALMGPRAAAEKALRDDELCKRHFGTSYVETRPVSVCRGWYIFQAQSFVVGERLTKAHMSDTVIAERVRELLRAHEALIAECGYPVDLMGRGGLVGTVLDNVFVTPEKELRIIDATVLVTDGWTSPFVALLRALIVFRQTKIIASLLSAPLA